MFSLKDTHNQSINQQISLKQTYTVETFESSRNPNVLSASRFRSRSPSGLASNFPIVALLALTVSIDRQVIQKSKLGNISSSGDTGALIRLVKKSGRAPFSFLIREVARPAHTSFTFVPSLPFAEDVGQNSYRLPGDYGFDPLGLGKDPAFLKWYREAELIHGRWAMTAVVGIFVGQAWSGVPWFQAGADPSAVAPFSFGSLLGTQLLLMGWVESKRWVDFYNPESQSVEWATPWSKTAENFSNFTGEQGYPGGKFFDPLGFAGTIKDGVYIPDTEKLERLQLAEIKHSRLAMLAMLIFYFEAGQGKTPLGALGL